MFRQILSAFRSKTAVDRALSELAEMLDDGLWMFTVANDVLHNVTPADDVQEALYRRDRAINELEQSIRRKVIRYLAANPGYDVPICIALLTVARDAERIGDYCKNVFEVGQFYREGFHVPKYHDPLDDICEQTQTMFGMVSAAWTRHDDAQAEQAVERFQEIRRRCDWIIEELFKDESQITTHEAVAYSLLARHYKRVAAHLSNIAHAVLGNVEHLDLTSAKPDNT